MVQFVDDPLERGGEVGCVRQLEIAAASSTRDFRQTWIRFIHRATAVTATAASTAKTAVSRPAAVAAAATTVSTTRPPAAIAAAAVHAGETDRIHHHVLFFSALHHILEVAAVRAGIERRVDTIREHENHTPAFFMQERGNTDIDGAPQRRRPFFLQLAAENLEQLAVIAREGSRVDLNAVRKAADARAVGRSERVDE